MTNNQITFNDLPQVVAELRDEVSGMKTLSHMVGHELQCRYQRIISSQANRLADATFSKSWEA